MGKPNGMELIQQKVMVDKIEGFDLNFVLKVEEFNQDGPRLGSIVSPGGRATVSPFNDRWLRKVVSPEKLLNQEGHEADDIAAFRRFRNLYEAEI
ncbi:hypothetical protein AAFF_G00090720 [Aldrovandia affinis]|uniref:Uncharacterized protein n=1 Tax=Aldrovandia affinis TaxID=143900 RepID=A0AAD7RVZ5_9TELE|nr:hypothetical protein AAFF_G00090720 [Aldrovandia affinis]